MTKRILGLVGLLFAATILMGAARSSRTALSVLTSEEHPEVWQLQVAEEAITSVSWSRLEISVDLPVGSQVELWGDVSVSEEPWDSVDQSGLLDVWIVDERTEGVVLFDLTRTLHGETPPRSFLIRVVNPEAGPVDVREESVTSVLEVRR